MAAEDERRERIAALRHGITFATSRARPLAVTDPVAFRARVVRRLDAAARRRREDQT